MIQKAVVPAGEQSPFFKFERYVLGNVLAIFLVSSFACCVAARAQSLEDVNTNVRSARVSESSSLDDRQQPVSLSVMHVDVNLVLVPVTVNDTRNRAVMGLEQDNFTLLEDGREQRIRYFWTEDTPLSVGILVDVSTSMEKNIDSVREAVADFFNNANPDDDYFVIAFSDKPKLIANTTQSIGTIEAKLGSISPGGYTALLDAIYMGMEKLRNARYDRRALVIISDGGDNVSRHKLRQIRNLVEESDAELYAIRLFDSIPVFRTIEEKLGNRLLSELTEATGGRTISVDNPSKLPDAAAAVSHELRSQYILGYRANNAARDGKWHKIKVRATAPQIASPLQVYSKTGYVAPLE